jgi:hypothetical protein
MIRAIDLKATHEDTMHDTIKEFPRISNYVNIYSKILTAVTTWDGLQCHLPGVERQGNREWRVGKYTIWSSRPLF